MLAEASPAADPGLEPQAPFAAWDARTLIDLRAERNADKVFLIWEPFEGEGRQWTYAQFAHDVKALACGLQSRGVMPGERILVHLDNCPESIITWLGCAYAGCVAVMTNARSSQDELSYFIRHSRAVGAVTQPSFADIVQAAGPHLAWTAITATDAGAPPAAPVPNHQRFAWLFGDVSQFEDRATLPLAPFAIQYTSGTTSRPKAVVWTHANFLWGARVSAMHEDLRPQDVHLVHLPLFHTNAQIYSIAASMWVGASAVLMPRFSASRFWPISLKHKCSWTSMVPFTLKALAQHEVPAEHSYRFWGGGVCEPVLADQHFRVKTIGWWGMTETITHGTVGSAHTPDAPMSIGQPSSAYDIFVLNENGAPVRPGETGDLLVRGRRGVSLFLEYADDSAATAAAFREDGLFITGDRVRLGTDGFLYFADRSKDMLKVGGENVAASEIERVIGDVGGVAEVAVVAQADPMLDEVPVAFVIARHDDHERLRDLILKACARSLASFKQPRRIVFVDDFPRATLGKVAKAELRRRLADPSLQP